MTSGLVALLSNPWVLGTWMVLVGLALAVLVRDLRRANPAMAPLMKWVWLLTVLYSGPLGLAGYYWAGRSQIARDTLWRRAFRSVAHCYSGCGAGEVAGVLLAVGVLGVAGWSLAALTFALAYLAGFAMTAGPLVQEGMPWEQALWDAFYSETASITVMEVTAIGVDMALAGDAGISEPLFWTSLAVSLSAGLVAAYPVNVLLIRMGVKSGMHDPRETHAHHG